MQKKRKIIIIIGTVLATVILLAAAGAAFFLWRLPHFWLDKLQNEYLLQNRNILRIKSVRAGAFNKFILQDVQLGSSRKPLFTAPQADLILQPDFKDRFTTLPIKSLKLYGCKTKLETSDGKVYINGILLEKLVKSLSEISSSTAGKPLTLIIQSQLVFGNKKPSADLLLTIRTAGNKLNIQGEWSALADKKLRGCWQTFIDLENDVFSVTLADSITEIFMQEILLRSGADSKTAALLHKGIFSGEGNFSGTFSNLEIKELTYSGKVEKPVIAFYKHKIKNVDSFELKIEKNTKGLSCTIPQLSLNKTVLLKNISINSRKKITFTADCNFQQLAADCFSGYDVKIQTDDLITEKLRGSWDTRSNVWHLSKQSGNATAQPLRFTIANSTVAMLLEKFNFKAEGKASAGTLTGEIKFKNLELYNQDSKKQLQIAQGSANAQTVFGSALRPDQHTLAITGSDFSAVVSGTVIELPGFSASAELQKLSGSTLDTFVSFSGAQARISNQLGLISAISWHGLTRFTFNSKEMLYNIKTLDFKSDELKLEYNKKLYTIPQAHIQLNGSIKEKQLCSSIINASAGKIIADQLNIDQAVLKADYNAQRPNNEKLQFSVSTAKGIFPAADFWGIQRALNINAEFAGAGLIAKPHRIALQAEVMDWDRGVFSGTFQNSKWKMLQAEDQSWNCTTDFDYLRLQSKKDKFGSSQFGKSSLSANLILNNNSCQKLKLFGISGQISCRKGDYHIGSESMQCDLTYTPQAAELLQGSITMNNTNILGPQLTASTPALQSKFTAISPDNITGNIDFASGSITNQSGELELRKVSFSLPLLISRQAPARFTAGKITAGEVFYKQKREGSFSGSIRHFMQLPASVTDTLAHQVEIEGKFLADKFDKSPVKLNSTWLLPPEKNSIKWQFNMPESKLIQPLILSEYLHLPVNSAALKGKFTLNGSVSFNDGKLAESTIKLNSINSDWQFGTLTAQGLTAAGVLTFAENQYALLPHDVTIGKLLWNNWELLNNELNVSLNNEGKLQIANWQASLLGGRVISTRIPAINLYKTSEAVPVKFALEDIPLTGFFNQFNIKSFISDARLAGDIQLNINDQGITVENSELSFKAPAGKNLQLNLANPADLKMRDIQFRDFTLAVLKAMKCYQANFNFSTAPGEVVMQVKAEGAPAQPIPFVYQGRSGNTPFRPADPGENGFAGEIELNINLKLHPETPGA